MNNEMTSVLWDYYTCASQVFGRGKKAKTEETEQKSYSLLWFYADDNEKKYLNDLTKAFLGDEEAYGKLKWKEMLSDHETANGCLEGNTLNESQKRAVKTALMYPVSFIQGPPGTGKTTTIMNLISCIAKMGKNAAVVSANSNALKAIHEKEEDFRKDKNIPDRYKTFGRLGNQKTREKFYREHGFQTESKKEEYQSGSEQVHVWKEQKLESGEFLKKHAIVTSTINSLKCCFKDSNTLQYDYVIIDETSQVDVVKGIVAMSCAKHLVLVGDERQLPPVLDQTRIDQFETEFREKFGAVETDKWQEEKFAVYKMQENKSFLDMCLRVFQTGKKKIKVFLNEHYRCHPGIIRFCSENIYTGEGEKLKIVTPKINYDNRIKIPIKILWYEGDYCEKCFREQKTENKVRSSKQNQKQIEIFMREEFPELLERMEKTDGISGVCILSPFKGQIDRLKESISFAYEKYRQENNGCKVRLSIGDCEKDNEEEESLSALSMLTIHKSQGREFDIVYFLPAEDGEWEWPWSQKKRLVNVAVSRAKKELRIIVSTELMSTEVKKWLLKGEKTFKPVISEYADVAPEEEDDLFVKKLIDYVYQDEMDHASEADIDRELGFRFHKSAFVSVFDRKPDEKQDKDFWYCSNLSKPERSFALALKEMFLIQKKHLTFYSNVRMKNIQDVSGKTIYDCLDAKETARSAEYREYISNGAEFDFMICNREGKILMAIEVDGLYHRFDYNRNKLENQQKADALKEELAQEVFQAAVYMGMDASQGWQNGKFSFLRIPCDGSTYLETDSLRNSFPDNAEINVFTVEDILRRELENNSSDGYYFHSRGMVKTSLYLSEDPELKELFPKKEDLSKRLKQKLLDNQYLRYCNLESKKVEPTIKGNTKGIVWGQSVNEKGEAYAGVFYSLQQSVFWKQLLMCNQADENSIEKFSLELYSRFEKNIRNMAKDDKAAELISCLEKLVNLTFTNLNPDYSDIHVQELYLLRYMPAYAWEYQLVYKKIYKDIFCRQLSGGETIEVTSVGCGNMVDYWGLSEAFRKEESPKVSSVKYTGVDATDWNAEIRIPEKEKDTISFIRQRAEVYFKDREEFTSDLYVFPKSISEFENCFHKICKMFRKKRFTKDKVCILTVFRSNRDNFASQKQDNTICDCLVSAMEDNCFSKQYDRIWVLENGNLEEKEQMDDVQWEPETEYIDNLSQQFQFMRQLEDNIDRLLNKAVSLCESRGKEFTQKSKDILTRHPRRLAYCCCRVTVFHRKEK